ncbi:MAG: MGMT family protein [Lachnospiraceae bacterium]|nr:MGMT family protein [Lachnospiraceae bacterium]
MGEKIDKQIVYNYLAAIPKGKVVTYGQIAEFLGNKNFARVVGTILHDNPDGDKYPCYKVVNAKGSLAKNYAFGGADSQKIRLEAEGIIINNNKVDLNVYQWLYGDNESW